MAVRSTGRHAGDTKSRILDAAETLFIENGYEAMSLRQITSRAEVNLAAVNYHFGSKEALMHAMLSRRLDRLNQERLKLLDRFDTMLGDRLTCEHVLGAMFIPALRLSRDSQVGGKAFLRLLGRAYTDPSSFIRDFLAAHYATVAERFFTAFQRALPHLPREELGWRLHFAIGALSGVLAGADTESLIVEFSQGKSMNDLQLIARLASLMVSALKAPLPDMSQLATFAAVLGDAADGTDASEVEHFCPLVGVAKAAAQQGTADAPVRSVETSPAATTGFSPAASASPRTVTNVETRPAANAASSTATNTDTGSIASANAEPKESSANALHGDASKPVTEAGSTHASAQDSSAGNEVRSVRDDGSSTDRPASEPRDVARRDAEPQLNATLETREARETRDTRGDTLDARHDEDEGDDDRATHRDGTSRSEQRPHHRVA